MSLNTSHTPDGHGILIYNGEMILLYTTDVKLKFEKFNHPLFKSNKTGALYLTSHRIIFMNDSKKDDFKSFAMPFHSVRDVKLEQPLLTPNYLKGWVNPLPGGNFEGCPEWRLTFPKGGCIEFGEALLRAADMASRSRPYAAPPAYGAQGTIHQASTTTYYAAPPTYYLVQGSYQGFQAPTHVFPERPPAQNVYVYDMPPPYPGIGQTTPYPAGQLQPSGTVQYQAVTDFPVVGQVIRPGQPQQPQQMQYQPYPTNQPPQAGFVVGQGAAPSGLPQYQQLQQQPNSQPPAYSAYQEAPPLPSKNGPL